MSDIYTQLNKGSTDFGLVLELEPLEILEKRMARVVDMVNLADEMGFNLNGFMDENDLISKIEDEEVRVLNNLISEIDQGANMEDILKAELKVEKFKSIAQRILDSLSLY